MRYKIGGQFGNNKSIKILMSHPYVKEKFGFNPAFLSLPISLLTKKFGFPPPPFSGSKTSLNTKNFVMKKILDRDFDKFLEFGSGYGNFALTLAQITNSEGICIDMDDTDVNTLNKLAIVNNIKCKAITENILNYDMGKDNFDLIYSIEVMEHIEDDRLLLEKSYKALRKGGRFIFQTPFHFNQIPETTDHEFGHVRNGYSETAFEKVNNKLLEFEYFRLENRKDGCDFCGEDNQIDHPLKLVGVGIKK